MWSWSNSATDDPRWASTWLSTAPPGPPANGQRHVGNKSGPLREHNCDPDASWATLGHLHPQRVAGTNGCKVYAAVCTRTGLPVAWRVVTASTSEWIKADWLHPDSRLHRGYE